ncbi:hypothetical protein NEOLEDRAFT_1140344 [Neolentinus lepideus HHB14362 ss-1]|uniref:Nucleoporin Nup82 n=1 Tax=Neolentinus lepideus HHB14362 ss-1 TaxID=1314782 RepID=A0A165PBJ1_9AGAM|nr:hypothetical protein NEOLEDRAFT_1140344 [Neolentinus lepideus HHB14362 ss-1]
MAAFSSVMDEDIDWTPVLSDHPIFQPKDEVSNASNKGKMSALELSTSSFSKYTRLDPGDDGMSPSGRRQVMAARDGDLIVAVGEELRIMSLGESKLQPSARKSYKVLYTPNIAFEITQLAVNLNGKLLAVAGAYQVAVVVLPKPGFAKLVTPSVDCKSIQVGQFYHASATSIPIAKIEWHPWGEGGSTLLVMTVDGKLRGYDVSVDPEEPQQMLSFVPQRKRKSYLAQGEAERVVASFALGKGRGDWGPLTVYALMRSGDIYAISPYMPVNSSIPSDYVHSLDCFVAAKQQHLTQEDDSPESTALHAIYEYQRKYVAALVKQLPSEPADPADTRPVHMHPPNIIKIKPARQGPFLMQPAPRELVDSEDINATDIAYLTFDAFEDHGETETERLGIVAVAYEDGRVDVCMDVEKIEPKWDNKSRVDRGLPMLAVYETIDLGLLPMLSRLSSKGKEHDSNVPINHPVLLVDPIHEDVVYVYHAFGLHVLHLGPVLQSLTQALKGDEQEVETAVGKSEAIVVRPMLSTFSGEQKLRSSNPVISVVIPSNIYLTSGVFVLTSMRQVVYIPLTLDIDEPPEPSKETPLAIEGPKDLSVMRSPGGPPAYVSLLGTEFYDPPSILSNFSALPPTARPTLAHRSEMITPDILRFLGTIIEHFTHQIGEVRIAHKNAEARHELQIQEYQRQQEKLQEMNNLCGQLKGARHSATLERARRLQEAQKALFERLDRTLQAMMRKVSPELNQHERKWFEELKRMKGEVLGATRYDEESLSSRVKLLRREYDRLLPNLKELQAKEVQRKRRQAQNNQGLGVSQAFELGERSNEERSRIHSLGDQISRLATRLDITLGHAPPLKD